MIDGFRLVTGEVIPNENERNEGYEGVGERLGLMPDHDVYHP
jgi:hypothetical protein